MWYNKFNRYGIKFSDINSICDIPNGAIYCFANYTSSVAFGDSFPSSGSIDNISQSNEYAIYYCVLRYVHSGRAKKLHLSTYFFACFTMFYKKVKEFHIFLHKTIDTEAKI